ncbi:CoA pyrophosphatase [Antrihabitans sp. YC2-6]|uniref:NUDIX hydrolase n=1 Tax=Antrihabitans sp. YC2-6 TaxID=2799498 RepID=UPI0018F3A97C|nr:CoA pyrophosphatase [Antrihabitans sp. YC2-6]MBJ8348519.1 CoA pyrophosphatase [Antrihabitans sp. YC2-6]
MNGEPVSDLTRDAVADALGRFDARLLGAGERRHAAVVVAVGVNADSVPAVLLTMRPARMRAHPGQFALPGGAIDPGESVAQAALRELREELAIEADESDIVGRLDDYATRSGYVISPLVLWIGDRIQHTVPNSAEVAEVLLPTIAEVDVEPRFIRIPESDRPVIQWPYKGALIHAPTGAIVYQFREVVLRGRSTRVSHLEQPVFAWR